MRYHQHVLLVANRDNYLVYSTPLFVSGYGGGPLDLILKIIVYPFDCLTCRYSPPL